MTSESHVRKAVVAWLYRHHWNNLNPKEKGEHGPDIRVKKLGYSRYFIIEVKGDPIDAKHPDSSRTACFWVAIGQIVTHMKTKSDDYYGIALPKSYDSKIKNLPWVFCRKNRLSSFLVDGKKVEHLTWRDLQHLAERRRRHLTDLEFVEPERSFRWAA